jgi:hypothetical protein
MIAETVFRRNSMNEEIKQHATLTAQASHNKDRPVASGMFLIAPLAPKVNTASNNAAGVNAKKSAKAENLFSPGLVV